MHRLPVLSIAEDAALSVPPADLDASEIETIRDERGVVWGSVWERGATRFVHLPDIGTFALEPHAAEVVVTVEPQTPRDSVVETYERFIAPVIRLISGAEVLHASAVRTSFGVVAFCGGPETGKSTLAYGLSLRGFEHWADDAVALDLSEGRPLAVRLRTATNLRQGSRAFFDAGAAPEAPRDPGEAAADAFAPLAAVLVLRRNQDAPASVATGISRLRGGRSFDAVVQHAFRMRLRGDEERRRRLVENYMALAASTPIYRLELRWGFEHLPAVLAEVARWLSRRRAR